ncbi:MAG: hypothetical protein LBM93_15195 [Oscillospiraceae bacterium]|jgi:hypothetical protein|nr:hypothetical protein [Oscillospiraceae bacterium]
MKKIVLIIALLSATIFSATAKGFYFETGLGLGVSITELENTSVSSIAPNLDEMSVDIGFKMGYGPLNTTLPLYIVGEFAGAGHRLGNGYSYVQFNSYIIGPGIVIYLTPIFQVAGSFGFSLAADQFSTGGNYYGSGFAGNASLAFDIGKYKNGCLIGFKWFGSSNTLTTSVKQNSNMFGIFVKYTFRHKDHKWF